jgi:serine/threonine protein kinase
LGNHEDILGVREYFIEDGRVYLIMELMEDGTDLLSLVMERGTFCEQDTREVFTRLLRALEHCHKKGIAHRDVKLENMVVSNSEDISSVKLIDFGLAGVVTPEKPFLTERCGTPAFAAPEVLRRRPAYDTRCDLWSAGTALYTLLCGEPPFKAENLPELVRKIHKCALVFDDPAWALVSPEAVDLVKRLLTPDPDKRISLSQAFQHPWILG